MTSHWEQARSRLYRRARRSGRLDLHSAEAERRAHPRFRTLRTTVFARSQGESYDVANISEGGLAFRSTHSYNVGERVALGLEQYITVEVEVVGCEMVEKDAAHMEYEYLVRCRTLHEDTGRVMMAIAMELELQAEDSDPPGRPGPH